MILSQVLQVAVGFECQPLLLSFEHFFSSPLLCFFLLFVFVSDISMTGIYCTFLILPPPLFNAIQETGDKEVGWLAPGAPSGSSQVLVKHSQKRQVFE